MAKRTIKLEILPDGTIDIKTVKSGGVVCKGIVDKFAAGLGLKVDESTRAATADQYSKAVSSSTLEINS